MFAPRPEILAYLQRVARDRGVLPKDRSGAEMRSARWDEAEHRWTIETASGSFAARVLVTAAGPLGEPVRPDIAGLDRFEGPMFHSAHWKHDEDLRGRRVAVIGTGATSAQFIPHVQPLVSRLTVFQRTPAWVFPRPDFPHPPALRRAFRLFPSFQRAVRNAVYYFAETLVYGLTKNPNALKPNKAIARWNLHRAIKDPALRAKLTPDYRIGCKRILLSSAYYPALARPNVDVVASGLTRDPRFDRRRRRRDGGRGRRDHLRYWIPRHRHADRRPGRGRRRQDSRRGLEGRDGGPARSLRGPGSPTG